MPVLPDFVQIGKRKYDVILVNRLQEGTREVGWWVSHRAHHILLSRAVPAYCRRRAVNVAAAAGRKYLASRWTPAA